jgi:hypothetical protein
MRNPDRRSPSIGTIDCTPAKGQSRNAKTACYANAIPYVAVNDSPQAFRKENRKYVDNTE